jgi:Tfp pilus assembly protein PilO
MKSILKKAGSIGKGFTDSVKETFDDVKEKVTNEEGFLVEEFSSKEDAAERLNALQTEMKSVDVQAGFDTNGKICLVIKVVD